MWNSRKVAEWIESRTGRRVSSQRGWEYLRRLGNTPKVPRPSHAKADPAEQEASKKAPQEAREVKGSLPAGRGRAVGPRRAPSWSEADHPQGVWSPKGQRPLVKVHQRYERTYLYSFVRRASGEVHWLILPTVNAEVFSVALSHFAEEVGCDKDMRLVLVLDQAGWHTAKEVEVPEGIHLEFLPSNSPELQPSERLWPLSRTKVLQTASLRRSESSKRHW